MFARLWCGCRPLLVLFCFATAGCATYGSSMEPVLRALVSEDFSRALRQIDKKPQPESALWLAERGLLLRYAGRLQESNEAFTAALARQEDLYTRSLSGEALSLAVNDAIRPYRLRDFEVPFLHLYPILNYLELGDSEGALVEARALSQMLEMRRAAEGGEAAGDWGLGRLLAGLVFESAAEWNDAYVAYRASFTAYRTHPVEASRQQTKDRGELVASLGSDQPAAVSRPGERGSASSLAEEGAIRCALQLGLTAEDTGVSDSLFSQVAEGQSEERGNGQTARLVVWIEEGLVPATEEVHLQVPILAEEKGWGEDRLDGWSRSVGDRALEIRHHGWDHRDLEVAYFLDVALPVLPQVGFPRPFAYAASLQLSGKEAGSDSAGGSLGTVLPRSEPAPGSLVSSIVPAEDVGEMAREDLDRRYPIVAARAAARAILKALATRAVEKKSGEVAGRITNLLGVAIERADTRSWSSLPEKIGLAVMEVPISDDGGRMRGTLQVGGAVSVLPVGVKGTFALSRGGWHFISSRIFP